MISDVNHLNSHLGRKQDDEDDNIYKIIIWSRGQRV